jgi:hypothetical protein
MQVFDDFGATKIRARGSLNVSSTRELLVDRAIRGAYLPDGTIAEDTLCLRREAKRPHNLPAKLSKLTVEKTWEEEVVWGGHLISHYGHFLTESVARLWPTLPGEKLEGLPVVFATPSGVEFVRDWLSAFGLNLIKLPVGGLARFTRMHVPMPAWRLDDWVAPEIRDIHLHARNGLSVSSERREGGVLWLSRLGVRDQRAPYDEALLQWLLRDRVRIISPETISLAEQIEVVEGSDAVAGVIGSAFHTLLMVADLPKCAYLSPTRFHSAYVAQDRLLAGDSTFLPVLTNLASKRYPSRRFPVGYRLLIPECLRGLDATVLPGLLEDPNLEALAFPERLWRQKHRLRTDDLMLAVAGMLLEPYSVRLRMKLAAMFEAAGLDRCAVEQFAIAAGLTDDYVQAPLKAARLFRRLGNHGAASAMARRALAIDPDSELAMKYIA